MENADTNANVVSRVQTSVGTTAGEFDDIVTWLPRYVLFNRYNRDAHNSCLTVKPPSKMVVTVRLRSFMARRHANRTAIAATTRGFTLVEIAVALFIVTLVLGSILVPLTSQVEQRQISDTRKTLEEIKEALMGFAVANGYLPCPAISATNGLEDRTGWHVMRR